MTEGEMFGWDPQFNEYEFGQTLGDCEGQGTQYAAVCGVTKSQT